MKHCNEYFDNEKQKEQKWKKEHNAGGFRCSHCKHWVIINEYIGTANRNHCNVCLWSKHVDENKGDRKAKCRAGMRPTGLTFKHEGVGKQGEIMIVHACTRCGTISINRIAGDDNDERILAIFSDSAGNEKLRRKLNKQGITALTVEDLAEVKMQLFGRCDSSII